MNLKFIAVLLAELLFTLQPASAADKTPQVTNFELLDKNNGGYHGVRLAAYGRLSIRLEDTKLDNSCLPESGLHGVQRRRIVEIMLFDQVPEYTEKEAQQYRTNLKRYSSLHGKCVWVVGIFDQNDRDPKSLKSAGTIKRVTYIGNDPVK